MSKMLDNANLYNEVSDLNAYIDALKYEINVYREALELIKNKHPRCDCMNAAGIATAALDGRYKS